MERRNALVVEHQHLVQPIARGLRRRLPPSFDLADLVQAGMLGLIQAADGYDSGRGVPFHIYARQRIRGAMLDSTRRRAWRESGHSALPDVADPRQGPDERAASRQAAKRMRGALLVLPNRERRLLILHVVDEIPLRLAGQRHHISKTRASQLIRRALRTLRDELAV
jgi:RNA polymerase sigma factor (sigma-70 family)